MDKNNYNVKIETISKEVSAKERVALKDTSNAVMLDKAVTEGKTFVIVPAYYAVLAIHNEKSEDKDYQQYVVVDETGTKYVTGSSSFFDSFIDIFEEMDGTNEEYAIEVHKLPSKNYSGKQFLTCSIV